MCGLSQFSEDAVKMAFASKFGREAQDLGYPEDTACWLLSFKAAAAGVC